MEFYMGRIVITSLASFLIVIISVSPSHSLCRPRELCCRGKNISCSSFDWKLTNSGKISWKRCFCDEFCMNGNDCCSDYKAFCVKKKEPCRVSHWSFWGQCSKKCGVGVVRRTRVIVNHPKNGGKPCPALTQMRACVALNCPSRKHLHRSEISAARRVKETAKIIPSMYSKWRDHQRFSMKKDIRKYLYQHYYSQKYSSIKNLCARYTLKYVKSSCLYSDKQWARNFHRGKTICVSCHPNVIHTSDARQRCPGIGDYQRTSRWKAVGVPYCDGTWTRVSMVRHCDCPANLPNSFTFV